MTAATAEAPMTTPAQSPNDGLPYRFEVVPLKHMIVDAYQRPLTSFVDKIVHNFDPALVGTLCLSERSRTKFAVIDGQTRAEGMKRLGLVVAPAIVYVNLTRQQEAALFAKFQTERRGMTSATRFKAQVIAGDTHAGIIDAIVKDCGFAVNHSSEPNALKAVAAMEFVYWGTFGRKGKSVQPDPDLLRDTLYVIRQAWPKLPDTAKSAVMIRGLGFFLAREPGSGFRLDRTSEVNIDRLVQRLGRVTPSDLAKRAEALREGRGMSGNSPAYMAEAIEAQYRKQGGGR